MTLPDERERRRRPVLTPRTMALFGVDRDGRPYVWAQVAQVQPLDRFPMEGRRIVPGHYVLERQGQAITAHIDNATPPGDLVIQYVGADPWPFVVPVAMAENWLLGRHVRSGQETAELLAILRQLHGVDLSRRATVMRRRGRA